MRPLETPQENSKTGNDGSKSMNAEVKQKKKKKKATRRCYNCGEAGHL